MKNILELLEETEAKRKDQPAVDDGCMCLTYTELVELSQKIGTKLSGMIGQGDPVVVLAEKSAMVLAAMFGVVYAGGFYVPVSLQQPSARIHKILETVQAGAVITDRANAKMLHDCNYQGTVLFLEDLTQGQKDSKKLEQIRLRSKETDRLYGIFTSGSTGNPKGIVVSHRSVIDFIGHFTELFEIKEKDVLGNQAPFDFDVSVKDIYSCVATGATLVIIPKSMFSTPSVLVDYLCEKKVTTLIWAVSALCLVSGLKGLEYRVPEHVRRVLFSGESMPAVHLRLWQKALPQARFVNLYGPTEITCNCTWYAVPETISDTEKLPIGRACPGRRVFLLDDDENEVCAEGETGEICVSGESLAEGYYHNPEQTQERFLVSASGERFYRTGDVGYFGKDGLLYFAGRRDFQIKHMGHRIELEEIEAVLNGLPGVWRSCCVFDQEKQRILAYYAGEPEPAEVRRRMKEGLPVYMVPHKFVKVDEMPVTKNGKLDRAWFGKLAKGAAR